MPLVTQEKIKVPDGIDAKVSGKTVEVSGPKGKLSRTFDMPNVRISLDGRDILAEADSARRKRRAMIGTLRAHIFNMFKGVTDGFAYKMRVVYSHFPITVKVEGERVLINNFLGERSPRVADIVGDATVEVNGDDIMVKGLKKDEVGQTAFNIEQATSIKYRDHRTFQDGCYIVERS